MLLGRAPEQRRIDELLVDARGGVSGALVLVGEAGIGKTALLEYAEERAGGFRILRARGVASEAELPFAALLDVCRPVLDLLERIEPQQSDVLRATFGLRGESGAAPFAIGAATLSLLATAAEEQPLLLLVDDAHWLDRSSADALEFAVRRMHADAAAALFATRPGEGRPFSGRDLPELELAGLDSSSAAALVERTTGGELDAALRAEVLELARGNPLALLELPRQPAWRELESGPLRIGKQLERAFAARAASLPPATHAALAVAAAGTSGDLGVLGAALNELGLSLEALEPAEAAGLVSLEHAALQFRHPLVRSALYHAADPAERRRVHAALARAHRGDDESAWHLAASTIGPDARAAAALERVATTASGRSGFAAAAAAYERAARLSDRRDDRLRRLTAAADSAWLAGRTPHALALVREAISLAEDAAHHGALLHLRGTIEKDVGDPEHAHRTLAEAATLLVETDPRRACAALNLAIGASFAAGDIERAVALGERGLEIAESDRPDQLLFASLSRGVSLLMAGQPEEGLPFVQRAAASVDDGELVADEPGRLVWSAVAALWLGDVTALRARSGRAVDWARERSSVSVIAHAARLVARAEIITGRWRTARAFLAESLEAARISGQSQQEAETLAVLAWLDAAQGRAAACRAHANEGLEIAERHNLQWRNGLLGALVLLDLGTGVEQRSPGLVRFREWLAERPLLREAPANGSPLPDVIEALVRLGDRDAAQELLAPFAGEAERLGQPFPRAVALRCRALLADEGSYPDYFEQALGLHALDANVFALARTRLAYGERMRRSGRRVDSRGQLRDALAVFERLEAIPWAERASRELRATGERVRAREPSRSEELTPQELQIAALAAEGKTNREVGARLFLSPKTIEWHLGKIYRKLGVGSRAELAKALDTHAPAQTSPG